MKALNDFIWNDEELELDSREVKASVLEAAGLCGGALPSATAVCIVVEYANCSVGSFTECIFMPSAGGTCTDINPILINGCAQPMEVSCGGIGVPESIYSCRPTGDVM